MREMVKRTRSGLVVILVLVVHQNVLDFRCISKSGLLDKLTDTPVEAHHFPIGLRMPSMALNGLSGLNFALNVEYMLPTKLCGVQIVQLRHVFTA